LKRAVCCLLGWQTLAQPGDKQMLQEQSTAGKSKTWLCSGLRSAAAIWAAPCSVTGVRMCGSAVCGGAQLRMQTSSSAFGASCLRTAACCVLLLSDVCLLVITDPCRNVHRWHQQLHLHMGQGRSRLCKDGHISCLCFCKRRPVCDCHGVCNRRRPEPSRQCGNGQRHCAGVHAVVVCAVPPAYAGVHQPLALTACIACSAWQRQLREHVSAPGRRCKIILTTE
jgi:hypothetical protein